jgi:hypothetical protein
MRHIRTVPDAGTSVRETARKTGFDRRSIKMVATDRTCEAAYHCAKTLLSQLFSGLLIAPLGGRLRPRQAIQQ